MHRNSNLLTRTAALLFVCLFTWMKLAGAARSSPDINFCESWQNNNSLTINCLSGSNNFCCNNELVKVDNVTSRWSKVCCSQRDYVLQNSTLFLTLIICNLIMVSLVLIIILASFGTIILTQKAALD